MLYFFYGSVEAYSGFPSPWLVISFGIEVWNDVNHVFCIIRSFSSLAAFTVLSRLGWDVSVALILFTCIAHPENFVNCILSLPVWEPFSRLTFGEASKQVMSQFPLYICVILVPCTVGAYMLHPIIMQVCYYSVVQQFRFSGLMAASSVC